VQPEKGGRKAGGEGFEIGASETQCGRAEQIAPGRGALPARCRPAAGAGRIQEQGLAVIPVTDLRQRARLIDEGGGEIGHPLQPLQCSRGDALSGRGGGDNRKRSIII